MDIFTKDRQAWLRGARRSAPNDPIRRQAKVDAAREAMGEKFACHPANRVQRVDVVPRVLPAWAEGYLPLKMSHDMSTLWRGAERFLIAGEEAARRLRGK